MQQTILITEGADPKPLAWIRQRANVIEAPVTDPKFDREKTKQFLQGLNPLEVTEVEN